MAFNQIQVHIIIVLSLAGLCPDVLSFVIDFGTTICFLHEQKPARFLVFCDDIIEHEITEFSTFIFQDGPSVELLLYLCKITN
jgi:hypothetical protein